MSVTVPTWLVKLGKPLWEEDDARPPDAEDLRQAWQRLFGEPYPGPPVALASHDLGDTEYLLHAGGRVACVSYPGNSAIYQVGMMVPPLPRQVWALWNDDPDVEAHGNWVTSIDDAPGGETYLVSFSEAEATSAAIYQNENYGLRCRPMRIK